MTNLTIPIESLRPPEGGSPLFIGIDHGAKTSFFVVDSPPGKGARKHRHPYEEIFIILQGEIEAIVDGVTERIPAGNIRIIPAMAWHEFKNVGTERCLLVNIHSSPEYIQEDWEPGLD